MILKWLFVFFFVQNLAYASDPQSVRPTPHAICSHFNLEKDIFLDLAPQWEELPTGLIMPSLNSLWNLKRYPLVRSWSISFDYLAILAHDEKGELHAQLVVKAGISGLKIEGFKDAGVPPIFDTPDHFILSNIRHPHIRNAFTADSPFFINKRAKGYYESLKKLIAEGTATFTYEDESTKTFTLIEKDLLYPGYRDLNALKKALFGSRDGLIPEFDKEGINLDDSSTWPKEPVFLVGRSKPCLTLVVQGYNDKGRRYGQIFYLHADTNMLVDQGDSDTLIRRPSMFFTRENILIALGGCFHSQQAKSHFQSLQKLIQEGRATFTYFSETDISSSTKIFTLLEEGTSTEEIVVEEISGG